MWKHVFGWGFTLALLSGLVISSGAIPDGFWHKLPPVFKGLFLVVVAIAATVTIASALALFMQRKGDD
jgi:hypothetical protein